MRMKRRLVLPFALILILSSIPGSSSCDVCPPSGSTSKCEAPQPPRGGFMSCKETPELMKNCVGTCLGGYVFPDGKSRMILECDGKTGIWHPQRTFANCVDEDSVTVGDRHENYEVQRPEGSKEKLQTCPEIGAPANGYFSCRFHDGRRKCYGSCRPGYYFHVGSEKREQMELECLDSGRWYPYQRFFDCQRGEDSNSGSHPSGLDYILERCKSLSAPAGGRVQCNYDSDQMTCKAVCYTGYVFPGRVTQLESQCFARTAYWSPYTTFPDCTREGGSTGGSETGLERVHEVCKGLSAPAGGSVNCEYDSSQMTCKAECYSGYVFPGRLTELQSRCFVTDGRWSPFRKFPDCKRDGGSNGNPGTDQSVLENIRERCRRPSAPVGGRIDCNYDSTQMTCRAECYRGYVFPGRVTTLESQCYANTGYWSPYTTFPNCTYDDGTNGGSGTKPDDLEYIQERCKSPNAPAGGEINCRYDSTQMTCKAECHSGYVFPGGRREMETQCYAETAYWSPYTRFPDCEHDSGSGAVPGSVEYVRERCRKPEPPVSGRIDCSYDTTHVTCRATCYSGYTFYGRQEELYTQCYADSGYFHPYRTLPECQQGSETGKPSPDDTYEVTRHRCGRPSAPANGRYNCLYNETHMECKGECKEGYSFPDGRTEVEIHCLTETGYWYPYRSFQGCEQDNLGTCGELEPPVFGRVNCYQEGTETHCQGSCYSGYRFPNGRVEMTLKCSKRDGVWYPESQFPHCQSSAALRTCDRPQAPSYGRIECNRNAYGMRCVGTCDEGYTFPNGDTELNIQCLTEQGNWYPFEQFPSCHSKDIHFCHVCTEEEGRGKADLTATLSRCRRPETPVPGEVQCRYDHIGMNCTGTCKRGYYFSDYTAEKVLTCLTRDGVWYPYNSFPRCTRQGDKNPEGVLPTPEPGSENKFLETFRRCPRPEPPTPGRIFCDYNADGMTCRGICSEGYYFPDGRREAILQCVTNQGYWSPRSQFPPCLASGVRSCQVCTQEEAREYPEYIATLRSCRRPDAPTPGRIHCFYNSAGMNCTGRCGQGYYFPGGTSEKTLKCQTDSGIWHPTSRYPACVKGSDRLETGGDEFAETLRRCRAPTPPSPGRLSCDYDLNGMYCHGICSLGYAFPGGSAEIALNCSTREGFWRPQAKFPSCEPQAVPCRYNCHQREDYGQYDLSVTLERCRRPSAPMFGRSTCVYDYRGMNCTATCKDQYHFSDGSRKKTTQCLTSTGTWYPLESYPSCVGYGIAGTGSSNQLGSLADSRCEHPSIPVPGWVSCSYNEGTVTCTGGCHNGYLFPGRSSRMTLECRINQGVWLPTGGFPQCEPPGSYDGDSQQGSQQSTSDIDYSVTASRCRVPSTPIPGEASCRYNSRGMNCTARCKEGYRFENGETEIVIRCTTINGVWHPEETYPKCVSGSHTVDVESERLEVEREQELLRVTLTKCRIPASPAHGSLSCTHSSYGMNCTAWCREGYYFPGSPHTIQLSCITDRGYWFPRESFPDCQSPDEGKHPTPVPAPGRLKENALQRTLRKCRTPEGPKNGYVLCKHNDVERNCTGWCTHRHYYPDGSNKITLNCIGDTGIWRPYDHFPPCTEQSDGTGGSYRPDYDPDGQTSEIKETVRNCPRPLSPSRGNISCEFDGDVMICVGICGPGYMFPDGKRYISLSCSGKTKTWHPIQIFPRCVADVRACRKPTTPMNGHISCSNDSRAMTCTATCLEGYRYPSGKDSSATRCIFAEGRWYPLEEFPDCEETDTTTQDKSGRIHEDQNKEDACKERPSPPSSGFLACKEKHSQVICIGTCFPGYKFSGGKSSMQLSCPQRTGRWTPLQRFPPCFDERTNKPSPLTTTEDRTSKNGSVNGGHPGAGSQTSEELERMCPKPVTPKGGYIDCTITGNLRKCAGTCASGYVFPNGRSYYILRCSLLGTWNPASHFPDCISKDRYKGGAGVEETRLNETDDDREQVKGICRRPQSPVSGYSYCVYNVNIMECTGKCGPGYRFPSGETVLIHSCDQKTNRWTPTKAFPDCKAICSSPCYNGGVCVRPEQCFCPQEYRGNYCEYPLSNCDPRLLEFAGAMNCSHTMEETICALGCPRGTKLNHPSLNVIRCRLDGTWTSHYKPRCVEDSSVSPIVDPCPDSQCSSGITEGLCQRPPTPRPGRIRCVHNSLRMECTGRCADGYRFTDGRQEDIRTCDKKTGVWSPVHHFPECKPICERGCQNGGECGAPNVCFCPMRFRGDQCQYPFSNCDPHRLRFAGIVRCNHTTVETVCRLECPEGTALDRPGYDTVRCSVEGVWSQTDLPRCVEDKNYERRLLESDHQSRMRYERQYRESEISRTEAENVKDESSEDVGDTQYGNRRPYNYDRQAEDKNSHRYEQNQDNQRRSSRLEQEDLHQHGGDNRGTVNQERDEFSTGEGRFRHYDDFLRGSGGREGYEVRRGAEHHRSSTRQSTETQELNHQYFRQSVNKKKTETYSEHSSHSEHQYSRFHKQHEHSGQTACSLCSP